MKAVKGSRNYKKEFELGEQLPLRTPLVLMIDPSGYCNFNCKFCPNGIVNKEHWSEERKIDILPYELFCKIIDDAAGFGEKIKVLRLFRDGEPLLNKDLPKMIAYARQKGHFEKIDFTTNGSLFTKEVSEAVIAAGVDRINISVEGLSSEDYLKVSGVKLSFEEFVENLRYLYSIKGDCEIYIQMGDLCIQSAQDEKRFYDIFGEVCDIIRLEKMAPFWPGITEYKGAENFSSDVKAPDYRTGLEICPKMFYTLSVNSDGSVGVCSVDYQHEINLGNCRKENIVDIWRTGEKLKAIQLNNLLEAEKMHHCCNVCGNRVYEQKVNLEPYRDKIVEALRKGW